MSRRIFEEVAGGDLQEEQEDIWRRSRRRFTRGAGGEFEGGAGWDLQEEQEENLTEEQKGIYSSSRWTRGDLQEEQEEIWKRAWIRWHVMRIWEERRQRIQNRQREFPRPMKHKLWGGFAVSHHPKWAFRNLDPTWIQYFFNNEDQCGQIIGNGRHLDWQSVSDLRTSQDGWCWCGLA